MDSSSFCYWLQGYFELGGENLSPQQVQVIKDHLALVFNKVTPSYDLSGINLAVDGYVASPDNLTKVPDTSKHYGSYSPILVPNFPKYPPPSNQQFITC